MTRFTRWLALLLLMALPAAATTTTCWDAASGVTGTSFLGGPVTRYQQTDAGTGLVAYQGLNYPAGNAAQEYAFFKTVFPDDGATAAITFTVWGAVPTVTEGTKGVCLALSAGVQPWNPLLIPVFNYNEPPIADQHWLTKPIVTPSATVSSVNQIMKFDFPAFTPTYQTVVDSLTGSPCTLPICSLQPMWVDLAREGTSAYATHCTGTAATTDSFVATILCMTR